eukprot:gnl/Dysnectes_brevis/3921_a5102_406.p1 GENE.gnl/Dysnectes_brevis/3921_a5102_406~~gnl/Dysnectes_brevis/3921_a5102_406.p1  ORF type:complete len:441 (+),score=88.63 gnl/Dysnectes_brevis/3921_a5102_406:139-1323(+)
MPETEEQAEFAQSLSKSLLHGAKDTKVMSFSEKAPAPSDAWQSSLKVLYSQSAEAQRRQAAVRRVPSAPTRVLDAPGLLDDFYINVLDVSKQGVMAIGLANQVYLWNSHTEESVELTALQGASSYVSSLRWSADGRFLSVGTSGSAVQLWDARKQKQVRNMTGHGGRVASLAWHRWMLCAGARDGDISVHDVRTSDHLLRTLQGHSEEVCGLQFNSRGVLASGSNDNTVKLWNPTRERPVRELLGHVGAVKALAWCPWQQNLLATGGGSADRSIRFWSAESGACLNHVDTHSQVSSLVWNPHEREILSAQGYGQNSLALWHYPSMARIAELRGHTGRILHASLAPDGRTVVSAGDDSLRFWDVFGRSSAADSVKEGAAAHSHAERSFVRGISLR